MGLENFTKPSPEAGEGYSKEELVARVNDIKIAFPEDNLVLRRLLDEMNFTELSEKVSESERQDIYQRIAERIQEFIDSRINYSGELPIPDDFLVNALANVDSFDKIPPETIDALKERYSTNTATE